MKAPAATVCADVIVVFGRLSEARLSHDAATAEADKDNTANTDDTNVTASRLLMIEFSTYALLALDESLLVLLLQLGFEVSRESA